MVEAEEADASKKGILEKTGDVLGAVGKTVADGANSAVDFTVEAGKGIKNFFDIKGEQDKESKFQRVRRNQL